MPFPSGSAYTHFCIIQAQPKFFFFCDAFLEEVTLSSVLLFALLMFVKVSEGEQVRSSIEQHLVGVRKHEAQSSTEQHGTARTPWGSIEQASLMGPHHKRHCVGW